MQSKVEKIEIFEIFENIAKRAYFKNIYIFFLSHEKLRNVKFFFLIFENIEIEGGVRYPSLRNFLVLLFVYLNLRFIPLCD